MKKFLAWWKTYFLAVVAAATNVAFYRRARERGIAEAAGHLAVLAAIVWIAPFSISFFLDIRTGLNRFMDGFRTAVPPGTVFELKEGTFSTNLEAPIELRSGTMAFIVNSSTSTLALGPEETGLVIDPKSITQKTTPDHREIVTYNSAPGFKTSKEEVADGIARYAKWAVFLISLAAISAAVFSLAVGTALSAGLHALLFWLLLRLLKRHWHYREAFVVALYASTVPILASALFTLAGHDGGVIPSALYWVLLGFVAFDAWRDQSPVTPKPETGAEHDQRQDPSGDRPGSMGRSA